MVSRSLFHVNCQIYAKTCCMLISTNFVTMLESWLQFVDLDPIFKVIVTGNLCNASVHIFGYVCRCRGREWVPISVFSENILIVF